MCANAAGALPVSSPARAVKPLERHSFLVSGALARGLQNDRRIHPCREVARVARRVSSQRRSVAPPQSEPAPPRPGHRAAPLEPVRGAARRHRHRGCSPRPPASSGSGSDPQSNGRARRVDAGDPAGADAKPHTAGGDAAKSAKPTNGQATNSQTTDGQATDQVTDGQTTDDTTDADAIIAEALARLGGKPADAPVTDDAGGKDAPVDPSKTPADLVTDNAPTDIVVGAPTPTPVPTVTVPAVAVPVIAAPGAIAPNAPTTAADKAPNVTADNATIAATVALDAQAQGTATSDGPAPGGKGTSTPGIADAPTTSVASKASIAGKALNAKQDPNAGAAPAQNVAPEGASEAPTDAQPTLPTPGPTQPGSPAGANGTGKGEPAPLRAGRLAGAEAPKPDEQAAAPLDVTINATADKPADPIQTVTLPHAADRPAASTATASTAATATTPAAANLNATPVPIAGLAVAIASQAQAGRNRFEIRLDPPELGRIDVRLDVDRDGRVTSRLVADRPETLDMLRRDAPDLQRALQDAGLKTSDSGMQFSLRDQGFGAQNQDSGSGRANTTQLVVPDPDMPTIDAAQASYGRMLRLGGGIDIRV
jgi:flagellar hook-length control protein FliK